MISELSMLVSATQGQKHTTQASLAGTMGPHPLREYLISISVLGYCVA